MMLVATLWIVFWRCSTDLISQSAERNLSLTYARVSSLFSALLSSRRRYDRADAQLRQPLLVQHRDVLVFDLHDVHVGNHVLRLRGVVAAARLRVEVSDELDVLLQIVDRHRQLPRQLGYLVVLQQPHVLGDDLLGRCPRPCRGGAAAAAGTPADRARPRQSDRSPARASASPRPRSIGHGPMRRQLFDGRHQLPVVVQIADDRFADRPRRADRRSASTAATADDPTATSSVESVFSIGGSSLTSVGVRGR